MKYTIHSQDLIKSINISLTEATFLVQDLHEDANIEALHQYRIKLRRSRGVLKTFDSVFQDGYSIIKRDLKKGMKPTNKIRDNDVFIEYLKEVSKNFSIPELASAGGIYEILIKRKENYYRSLDKTFLNSKLEKISKKVKKATPSIETINFLDLKENFIKNNRDLLININKNSHEDDFQR